MAHAIEKCKNISPFGNRLKVLMEERHLTQQQVAHAVGVSRAAVGTWLHGTVPGARELFTLAKFLKQPMESFFDAIPYVEPPAEALYDDPPGGVPVNFLSPEWRKFYAGLIEMMSTREGIEVFKEAFKQAFDKLLPAGRPPQAAPEITSIRELTAVTPPGNVIAMQSEIPKMIQRLKQATAPRGRKAELARFMDVDPPRVSEWLSGSKKPSGETTLRLLRWVEQEEAKQQQSASSVQAPPAPQTQPKAQNEKHRKSSPLKE